jgi:hypothetical protein
MRHRFALLEAIALVLLLGAWVMDWMYVRDIADANDRLRYSLDSAQDAFLAVDLRNTVQLEAAVTRACSSQGLAERAQANYGSAWASPEVREAWIQRTSGEVQNLKNLLLILRLAETKYRLPPDSEAVVEHVRALEEDFASIQEDLAAGGDRTTVLSPSQLGEPELRESTLEAHHETVALMNAVSESLAGSASSRSRVYQVFFMIGSALIVIARLDDWRTSRDGSSERGRRPSEAASQLGSSSGSCQGWDSTDDATE